MSKTLQQIAEFLGAELRGDSGLEIQGLAPLDKAKDGDITFLSDTKYVSVLSDCKASAVILPEKFADQFQGAALILDNPYLAFAKLSHLFDPTPKLSSSIHPTAVVSDTATLGENVHIGPYVVIEDGAVIGRNTQLMAHVVIGANSRLGDDCRLYPRVTVYHGVEIGNQVIIQSGAIIGSDGFGYANEKGEWHKIAQIGGVRVGNRVEIGANTTIDRGAIEDTIIEDNVILDNQIQIAHNVKIGYGTAMAACSGVAGSTEIGKYCIIGGGSCISGHLKIADGAQMTGMAAITGNIKEPGVYSSGTGYQETKQWRKSVVRYRQLDDMARTLKVLEKELAELKASK
ncbi:UDP-3-O-(3-hydroxymyristoyl)glucosamine N-acyltransferase [Litoribrevibacter albus]|uniref:UDP-3-O-acylglucosamine N-acyltransferase n=1 Tax=Litoribrevibacter albus TaxID=1473156 RepID=A0AA37W7A9_9GAMM|nr:UDP-3-O-(3-hydroxymyristoyl)glucosamine N-acyltransferase [Litoribrevibacter albus]GLQ31169.1 UDP-3-O-acylglucosamine N-acyltransferase [Litoribrevibacter albus]